MKSISTTLTCLSFLLSSVSSNAQITTSSQWTWMKGDSTKNALSVYGTQGVAAAGNKQGGRLGDVSWTDAAGNLWLFGGNDPNYNFLNDLWKYDPATNRWTWVKGDSTVNQRGVYGIQGTPAVTNKPGGRAYSMAWTDANGNFWLFGGTGYAASGNSMRLNDLWKYTPATNQWTWVKGDSIAYQQGVYGIQGTPAAANKPGARDGGTAWNDTNGNLWLFGGSGVASISSGGYLNDLWKYNIATNQWTWVNGANAASQPGTYGTQGTPAVANKPGARQASAAWTDVAGNLWLFGGINYSGINSSNTLNDLWKYTPSVNQWTWVKGDSTVNQPGMYGTLGIAATANKPGARYYSTTWVDNTGNLWLFGGYVNSSTLGSYFNDLWEYRPSTNQWRWVKGDNIADQAGIYGIQGTPAAANKPTARAYHIAWADTSGNFWLFGGYGFAANGRGSLNDLWKLSKSGPTSQPLLAIDDVSLNEGNSGITTFSFTVSLSEPAPAGGVTFDIATANGTATAGSDYVARTLTAQTIAADSSTYTFDVQVNGDVIAEPDEIFFVNVTNVTNASIIDGQGRGIIIDDELINNSITTSSKWTWMKGSNITGATGTYGTKGVAAAANTPGTRYGSTTWTDAGGNFWLFGGRVLIAGDYAALNDLWKYTPATNQWTWINGDSTGNQPGVYGTPGTAAATNKPGARFYGATWTDATGNLWLFGGTSSNNITKLSDLWKYNIVTNQWTWVNGANTMEQAGVYGTLGVAAAANRPGARYGSAAWTDAAGNFWLFGGTGYTTAFSSGLLNDLWKYNPVTNVWTWINGSNTNTQTSIYGTMGVPAAGNVPGVRLYPVSWTDASNNLWLFGGLSYNNGYFNDLWKYDPAINQWTWMKGDSTVNQQGVYGTPGTAATDNKPGARYGSATWTDLSGKIWFWGGYGYAATSTTGWLNDLWKYSPGTNQWTWINGANTINQAGIFGTQGVPAAANRPGARAYNNSWKDTSGNFWIFSGNGSGVSSDLWRLGNITLPNLTINDVSHSEGNSGTTSYTFTISLSAPAPTGGVTFDIATANGSAAAGSDYVARSLTAQTIAAGSSTYTFDVLVNGDSALELNETFLVNVSNATNAIITDGQGLGTIVNDDFLNDSITTASQWTWIKGSNTFNPPGVYGTLGVAAAANTPGKRLGSATWIDATGNLWLFGGRIFITGGDAMLNDLWKYNPATNQWTWVNGDSTGNQPGIYGTVGIAASTNKPGARNSGVAWTDAEGNFWLFGGAGSSTANIQFNDLWKYNPNTNQWTWVNGANTPNQQGVYGTKGVPAAANGPGARTSCVSWTGATGDFWLFGSQSYNDLWKYNPATNQWTWMNGNYAFGQPGVGLPGVYGVLGVPAASNTPGTRTSSFTWTDAAGKLWLFGGTQPTGNIFNDLWKYDPDTNQWTWIKGDSTLNQQGIYGTPGTAATGNKPGARSTGVKWTDDAGKLWLWGGYGYATGSNSGWLSDLWKYDPATSQWIWINGSGTTNQIGVFGTQGIPAAANTPGARAYSVSWTGATGDFWLFSGNAGSSSNDLWRLGNTGVSFVSANDGNWDNPSTWVGGIVPAAGSVVVVRNNVTVQANASCYSLRLEGPNGNVIVKTGVQFIVLH